MRRLQALILTLTFMTLSGCDGNGQIVKKPDDLPVKTSESPDSKSRVKIGEQFTLKMNESAMVAKANIEITVNRIGRKWLANGGGESLDFTFTVVFDGKSETYSHPLPNLITIGEYKIEVVKTEPFGDGYATFVVTKKDSVKDESAFENNTLDYLTAKINTHSW